MEVENDKHVKEVLAPNQMIELGNKGVSIKEVDVFEYICWKDNLMQVNDRKVGDVLNKLARYYGRTIVFDKEIAEIPLPVNLICEEVWKMLLRLFVNLYSCDKRRIKRII